MGYMDCLYRKEHIIGYTGALDSNPTVYFFAPSADENGAPKLKRVGKSNKILFLNGHITQAHPTASNVGRERAVESWSYNLMNVTSDYDDSGLIKQGEIALQETYHQSEVAPDNQKYFATPDGFSDFHISRSTFTQVSPKDAETLRILALAIARFPRAKAMYGKLADDDFETL